MSKTNVTNNHDGNLSVAGVDIMSGATAAVDTIKLKHWLNGHAAKTWVEQKVISIDDDFDLDSDDDSDDDGDSSKSDGSEDGGEGGEGDGDGSDGDDGEDDRESLIAQANALGIEFPPNTGNKKLKELIEAAQAE